MFVCGPSISSVSFTPLYLAAAYGYPKLVAQLLEWNACQDLYNEAGQTPLTVAVALGGLYVPPYSAIPEIPTEYDYDSEGEYPVSWVKARRPHWEEFMSDDSRNGGLAITVINPDLVTKRGGRCYQEVVNLLEAQRDRHDDVLECDIVFRASG